MKHLSWVVSLLVVIDASSACRSEPPPSSTAAGDAAFAQLVNEYLDVYFRRHPTLATDLGVHTFDETLDDYSAAGVAAEIAEVRAWRDKLNALSPASLSGDNQLDRDQLLHSLDASLLQLEVIKPWAKNPDVYSSGLTNTAYVMIKRRFAPPEERLRKLVTRMKAMPAALVEARKNLDRPPRVYTEIAIEQLDGNRAFFLTSVLQAFPEVKDPAVVEELKAAARTVAKALAEYKTWLERDLLSRSTGEFAYGVDTYRARLRAEEMIELPLDQLLAMAERDLKKNQAAFAETASKIDKTKAPAAVLAALVKDHPPASRLLQTTQSELDALAAFIRDHRIVTIPQAVPASVTETPPFMRATTSASMDIPGPFETIATEAYYHMTLPDPAWSAAMREEFMEQWYYPSITNVSVHEVWPGHYLQYLYLKQVPSNVRKVFGTTTNSEGWAHYTEQMMIDEGFHADDLRYRLAQIQDALLRNVRFIVGIKMHTQGMTIAEAEARFEQDAYQPTPVAKSETKRGTSDATYGYYTMGKLMIVKLRADYQKKLGSAYTLQGFHDAFMRSGPLALPLMRKAMLGEVGELF